MALLRHGGSVFELRVISGTCRVLYGLNDKIPQTEYPKDKNMMTQDKAKIRYQIRSTGSRVGTSKRQPKGEIDVFQI